MHIRVSKFKQLSSDRRSRINQISRILSFSHFANQWLSGLVSDYIPQCCWHGFMLLAYVPVLLQVVDFQTSSDDFDELAPNICVTSHLHSSELYTHGPGQIDSMYPPQRCRPTKCNLRGGCICTPQLPLSTFVYLQSFTMDLLSQYSISMSRSIATSYNIQIGS